jgi:AraC-like DNA-binding protein
MHRHGDARLVLFLDGEMEESDFEGARRFRRGEFVLRPAHFAHADAAGSEGAAYVRLSAPAAALSRWFARHGWRAGRGRIELGRAVASEELLERASPDAYAPAPPRTPRVRELADELGLEPHELTRRFKAIYGAAPCVYRRQARLQRAIKLLVEDAGQLAQIAAAAGFHDQGHLTTELRRETGLTPKALRSALCAR